METPTKLMTIISLVLLYLNIKTAQWMEVSGEIKFENTPPKMEAPTLYLK